MKYAANATRNDSPSEAVVVHCSDHRFQEGFREFLAEGLGLGAYALLAVPGGGHFVSLGELLPKFTKVGLQSVKFLVKRTGAKRIVLIAHDDCVYFKENLQFFFGESDLNQKQRANLRRARQTLREWFPGVRVELYLADAEGSGSLQFVSVE